MMAYRYDLHWPRLWQASALLWLALVIYGTLTPSPPDLGGMIPDKLEHFGAYAVLMWWFLQAWGGRHALAWGALLCGLGALLELAQALTETRTADLADMLSNGLGVVFGYGLWHTPLGRTLLWAERHAPKRMYGLGRAAQPPPLEAPD